MKDSNMFVSLHKVPFSRRGSFFAFYLDDLCEESFAMVDLYLGSYLSGASMRKHNRLMKVHVLHDGIEVPCALSSTPTELIMDSDYGSVRFCIAEPGLVRVKGTGGVGVRFSCAFGEDDHEDARLMKKGSVQVSFNMIAQFIFAPVRAKLSLEAPWNWRDTYSEYVKLDCLPDENGILDVAIEEFLDREGEPRDSYPSYEESVKAVKADFDDFMKMVPDISDSYCATMRERAAWTVWAHITGPRKRIKREMIAMMMTYLPFCFSWHQSYHAIMLSKNIEYSWQLVRSIFDFQEKDGHLDAFVTEFFTKSSTQQSPFQGFAINWLLKYCDLSSIPQEEIEAVYGPLEKWTQWWLDHRIQDGTGVPQYNNPDEAGWDDATIYIEGAAQKTPDLSSYLVLQTEALGKLAERLGRKMEADKWFARSKELLDNMIKYFWNGEQFVAINPRTGKPFTTDCICFYQPLMLGKRLPQNIIDKMAADLAVEGAHLTPYGIASEKITSPYADPYKGWMSGPIIAPLQFMMIIGLEESGKLELAKEVAKRYCYNLVRTGVHHIHNPFDGSPQVKGRDNIVRQHWTGWSASIFLFLASRYC
jgi:putative isomerase